MQFVNSICWEFCFFDAANKLSSGRDQGHHVAYHGGYVQGYRAEIAYCRDEDFGIAYLTNSPGGVGSGVVPELLDMWLSNPSLK